MRLPRTPEHFPRMKPRCYLRARRAAAKAWAAELEAGKNPPTEEP